MKRIAVFGLGRSGLAVAKAALSRGDVVRVVDQKSLTALAKPDIYREAINAGIEVELEWNGQFQDCDWVISNPAVPRNHAALIGAVKDGIDVLSEIEYAYRISTAPIVAITGTNGKSTTTVMTYLALKACEIDAVLCGNIYGSGYPELTLTDAADVATSDQVLVAEVSSFQLEWVNQFRPIAAAITNITSDHLDRYDGSIEEYAATKRRIFAAQTSEDIGVIEKGAKQIPGPTYWTVGEQGVHARPTESGIVLFDKPIGNLPFHEPHNRLNACVAALLATAVIDRKKWTTNGIARGLREFHGLAHRMQLVGEKNGIRVINNSMCTNPDAVIRSAESLQATGHLLIGGVNKDLDFAPLKQYLSENFHRVYLFGRDKEAIAADLGDHYPQFESMAEAFAAATQNAKSGEVIMLSPGCASSDQFRDFVDRGNVFVGIAKEWLHQ